MSVIVKLISNERTWRKLSIAKRWAVLEETGVVACLLFAMLALATLATAMSYVWTSLAVLALAVVAVAHWMKISAPPGR